MIYQPFDWCDNPMNDISCISLGQGPTGEALIILVGLLLALDILLHLIRGLQRSRRSRRAQR